jgi:hypothetical protein
MAPMPTTVMVAYFSETNARAPKATFQATASLTCASRAQSLLRIRMPLEENPNLAHASRLYVQNPRAKVSLHTDKIAGKRSGCLQDF